MNINTVIFAFKVIQAFDADHGNNTKTMSWMTFFLDYHNVAWSSAMNSGMSPSDRCGFATRGTGCSYWNPGLIWNLGGRSRVVAVLHGWQGVGISSTEMTASSLIYSLGGLALTALTTVLEWVYIYVESSLTVVCYMERGWCLYSLQLNYLDLHFAQQQQQ